MPDYSSMWAGLRSSLSPGDGESMYAEAAELPTSSADEADTGAPPGKSRVSRVVKHWLPALVGVGLFVAVIGTVVSAQGRRISPEAGAPAASVPPTSEAAVITALANDSKMMALPDPVQPTRKDIVTGAECYEISGGMQMDLRGEYHRVTGDTVATNPACTGHSIYKNGDYYLYAGGDTSTDWQVTDKALMDSCSTGTWAPQDAGVFLQSNWGSGNCNSGPDAAGCQGRWWAHTGAGTRFQECDDSSGWCPEANLKVTACAASSTSRLAAPVEQAGKLAQRSAPSGAYAGTKKVFGKQITLTLTDLSQSPPAFSMRISSNVGISKFCPTEPYSYDAGTGEVDMPSISTDGDCTKEALAIAGVKIRGVTYDAAADTLTVRAHYGLGTHSVVLTKVTGGGAALERTLAAPVPVPVQETRKDVLTGADHYTVSGGMQRHLRGRYERMTGSSTMTNPTCHGKSVYKLQGGDWYLLHYSTTAGHWHIGSEAAAKSCSSTSWSSREWAAYAHGCGDEPNGSGCAGKWHARTGANTDYQECDADWECPEPGLKVV